MPPETTNSKPGDVGRFEQTRWSIVIAAGGDSTTGRKALEHLCSVYWYPLYSFLRRQNINAHDAEDLTQGFFAHLFSHGALVNVDRAKGRFRTFLLASLKHFLADERDRAGAQKRGGGRPALSLDACAAEERYALEPRDELSPDRLFDRRWAVAVIEQSLARLRDEYAAGKKAALFDALKPLLTAPESANPYAKIGAEFGMNQGAVKIAVHRLRQRYGAALRAEIAETVETASEIDTELHHLLDALGS